jgi:hypothetical protein
MSDLGGSGRTRDTLARANASPRAWIEAQWTA